MFWPAQFPSTRAAPRRSAAGWRHRARARADLQADGLLEPYIAMGEQLRAALVSRAASHPLTEKGDFLQAFLEYDPTNLTIKRLSVKSGKADEKEAEIETPGRVRMARTLDDWAPREINPIDYTIENVWWNVMRYVIEKRYPDPDFDQYHARAMHDAAGQSAQTLQTGPIPRRNERPDGMLPSGLSLRSARYPGPDAAPEAWCCLGRSGLNRRSDLWRLPVETRFGGAITTTLGFGLLITPRAGFDHLAAVDHIV